MKYIFKRALQARDLLEEIIKYFEGQDLMENDKVSSENSDVSDNIYPDFETDMEGNILQPEGIDPDFIIDIIEQRKKSAHGGVLYESARAEKEGEKQMPTLKEGSITKRKDGRWMGRYQDQGFQKSVYANNRIDIINKVNECIIERDRRIDNERNGTVKKMALSDFIDIWFDEWILAKSRSKPLSNNTIQNVKFSLIKYIRDSKIAKKSISKISDFDIDLMIDDIPTKSMQARTYGYLKAVFDKAIMKKIIKESPFKFVEKRARPARKRKYIPDTQTMHEFLEWLKIEATDCYYIGKFIIGSGMRMGEVLALTWDDIDFDNKRASVNKAFSQADNAVVDHPKTEAGFRNTPLFDEALEVLNEIPVNKKTKEIFWMLSKRHISHKFPEKALKYGLPRLPIHNLRHYYASLCAAMGVDKKTYSLWMGHSDIIQTDDYTHNLSEFEQDQINKMAKKRIKKQ